MKLLRMHFKRIFNAKAILSLFMLVSSSVFAEDWITVNDMSLLKWQMAPDGKVYFRNLNDFRPQALPCCYNYYVDTTTPAGKSVWSVILTKMASSQPLILGVPNLTQPGPITYLGVW